MIRKLSILAILVSVILILYKLIIPAQAEPGETVVIAQSETDNTIISKEMLYGRLENIVEVVSVEQPISKTSVHIDDGMFGERQTNFTVQGTAKLGYDKKDIKILYIEDRTVHIELVKTKIISLELPYDQVNIEKVKGKLRRKMSDEDKKEHYKAIEKNIRQELMDNESLQQQVKASYEKAIKEDLEELGYDYVVFR